MFKRHHIYHDRYQSLLESSKEQAIKDMQAVEKRKQEVADFYDNLNRYRKQRELRDSEISKLSESISNDHLKTAIEAIYITALQEAGSLSRDGEILADNLVKNYIIENGGASRIMLRNSGKTYLLDFLFECVKIAHNKDMQPLIEAKEDEDKVDKDKDKDNSDSDENESREDIKVGDADGDGKDDTDDDKDLVDDLDDGDVKESDDDKSEDKSDKDESEDKDEDSDDDKTKTDKEDDKSEDKDLVDELDKDDDDKKKNDKDSDDEKDDKEESKTKTDDKSENDEDNSDTDDGFSAADDDSEDLKMDSDDDDDDEVDPEDREDSSTKNDSKEDDDKDLVDDLDTDDEDSDDSDEELSMDDEDSEKAESDSKEDMFEKLENDDTVDSAVHVIAQRIADAESDFIKKNAQDKEKIEKIADKIDNRIKAVTQSDKTDEEKDKAESELKAEAAKMSNMVRERNITVFEEMMNANMNYIMKDAALLESYSVEGRVDIGKVVESTMVQYGFLEFLNTVQLENVNEDYILKMINEE